MPLFISCTKEKSVDKTPNQIEAIKQVLSIQDISQQRVAYALLSVNQKKDIWLDRLNKIIKTNNLSDKQILFLKQEIDNLSPEMFIQNSIENIEFKESVKKRIKNEAISLFGFSNAQLYFTTLTSIDSNKENHFTTTSLQPSDCECSTSSDFCNSSYKCKVIGCTQISGCGFLWQYTCNGWCTPTPE